MAMIELAGQPCYHEQQGDGEPVLVLHGGFCSLETLRPQIDALAESFAVHAFERPGHGRSPDRTGPITHEGNLADAIAYLDAIGLHDVHVVGHSDGAVCALLMAIRHPDRVRSVVAIGANLDPGGLAPDQQRGDAWTQVTDAHLDAEYDALSPDPSRREDVRARLHRLWETEPRIPLEDVARIACPTLVVAGDHDVIDTHHTVTIAEALPFGQLGIVPGASHMVMLDRPELVNAMLLDFRTGRSGAGRRA